MDAVEKCLKNDFSFDVFHDTNGRVGLSLFVDDGSFYLIFDDDGELFRDIVQKVLGSPVRKVCFDLRKKMFDLQIEQMPVGPIYDIQILYNTDKSLYALSQEHLDQDTVQELREKEQRFSSHLRSARIAQIDLTEHSVMRLVPAGFVQSLLKLRTLAAMRLFQSVCRIDPERIERYPDQYKFLCSVVDIERNGTHLDVELAEELAASPDVDPLDRKQLRNVLGYHQDGMLYTCYRPFGTKTGRMSVRGGFGTHGIKRGPMRRVLTSRFPGGSIWSFDYNAIDYRCIAHSIGGEFAERFVGADDFHAATFLSVFEMEPTEGVRDTLKVATYISIYGGSPAAVSEKTGLSLKNARQLLDRLSPFMAPVRQFKEDLAARSRATGSVRVPYGPIVELEPEDHAGKILGLYAQGFSASMFRLAVNAIQDELRSLRSKVIFLVHDEVVVDVHPDEEPWLPDLIIQKMESPHPDVRILRARGKKGANYDEATG